MDQVIAEPIAPESRVKPGIRGTPVVIEGQIWIFADYVPKLEPVWDRLFDCSALGRPYEEFGVHAAAVRLLWVNFTLTPDEAAALVCQADDDDLEHAVAMALFGPQKVHRTFSQWVNGSLLANGLDPQAIPPDMLRPVLDILVQSGRTLPADKFISSLEAAAYFKNIGARS